MPVMGIAEADMYLVSGHEINLRSEIDYVHTEAMLDKFLR
jgi:hypothetical protein